MCLNARVLYAGDSIFILLKLSSTTPPLLMSKHFSSAWERRLITIKCGNKL